LFRKFAFLFIIAAALSGQVAAARAEEATVAVAASFAQVAGELAEAFEAAEGQHVVIAVGSSGKLASQILQGAPFDIFLSADTDRPADLVNRGFAAAGDRFTYALGRLALWSKDTAKIAIANPVLAPYGAAALETLAALGAKEAVMPRLVYGENVGQTFALARSGAAETAFIAWSQATSLEGSRGSSWLVPEAFHKPLRQDGVLLARGRKNAVARAFVAFLSSARARSLIADAGYENAGG
jgi:molybdate transport system substrate-binding protein